MSMCSAEFLLEDVKSYRYLTHGNVSVAGQDDGELYRQLIEAMDIMGFTKDEQDGMLFHIFFFFFFYSTLTWSVAIHNAPPVVTNSCFPPGRRKVNVLLAKVCLHCTKPGVARSC